MAVPVVLFDLAVMMAVPGSNPLTTPALDTRATNPLLVDHVTGAVTMVPDGPRTVAVSVTVPNGAIVADDGVTVTVRSPEATTVTVAVPA